MSDTDSFIEEVNEELRQDRLFSTFRRYGWIGILLVVGIVGGAAYNEWQKAQTQSMAQNLGDGLLKAEALEGAARDEAFSELVGLKSNAAVIAMLQDDGAEQGASALRSILADQSIVQLYRDLAAFKLATRSEVVAATESRQLLIGLDVAGSPLRVFASEQLALLDIADGNIDAAAERLQLLLSDNESSAALRRRVTQLIIALGKTPETV